MLRVGLTGGLASGKQESGAWSATIHAGAGTAQEQAQGVASFPIPLKIKEKVKLNYRNEAEALAATAPCLGSAGEPVVEKGNFCAYRGSGSAGIHEKGAGIGPIDRNVQGLTGCGTTAVPTACTGTEVAPKFEGTFGNVITETGEAGEGDVGVLLVFRTTKFSEATPEALEGTEEGLLNAVGSWGVTAK